MLCVRPRASVLCVRPRAPVLYVRGYAYRTHLRHRAAGAPRCVRRTRTSFGCAARTAYRGTAYRVVLGTSGAEQPGGAAARPEDQVGAAAAQRGARLHAHHHLRQGARQPARRRRRARAAHRRAACCSAVLGPRTAARHSSMPQYYCALLQHCGILRGSTARHREGGTWARRVCRRA